MPFGLIAAFVMLAGFVLWGVTLLFSRVRERPAEASSHYESKLGQYGGH